MKSKQEIEERIEELETMRMNGAANNDGVNERLRTLRWVLGEEKR